MDSGVIPRRGLTLDERSNGSKKHIQVSVRELVEQTVRSGDLNRELRSLGRPLEGLRAHQRIQKSRPPNYRGEVPVSLLVVRGERTVEITGRIDGVIDQGDRPVIEEIKTTKHSPATAGSTTHWAQVKVYAFLFAAENHLDTIDVQLTYHRLDTGETMELRERCARSDLEAFFSDLLSRYLQGTENLDAWRQLRDASIRDLAFPHPSYRPGQRSMAVEVYRVLKEGGQLTVQAPTGIGKTLAVLFPAIKGVAEGYADRIFYLTARTTARAVAESTLDRMRATGLRLRSVSLTAKEKICFNPQRACNGDECPFARGYYDRIDEALDDLLQREALTRDVIEETARRHTVCPFEMSLDAASSADCIIGDYNYAFDPTVYLRRFFSEERKDTVVLVDEAHNLVDRAREMFSAEIRKQAFLDLRRLARGREPTLARSLGRVNARLVEWQKKTELAGGQISQPEPPEGLYSALGALLRTMERHPTDKPFGGDRLAQPLVELYFDASRFLQVGEQYDETYATCFETEKRDLRVKLFCVDPSPQIRKVVERCRATVFFSATLSPPGYFQRLLGCQESTRALTLGSPFPSKNFCVLVSDTVSTLYRRRDETKHELTRYLVRFVEERKGNYLLFFPSYEYLSTIHVLFVEEAPALATIVQTPTMTEREREAFIARFRSENPRTLVGFAVMGGVFGEGVDLAGERLTGAAIIGVGLPGISLERELLRSYFDRERIGFEYAYLYPGIHRVLQAAGRVIRSETDRGAVLLIDERFSRHAYRALLPSEWKRSRARDAIELRRALRHFWNGESG